MVSRPGSTFTVREGRGSHHRFGFQEVWLSRDPGVAVTTMRECRDDQGFGHYIEIAPDFPAKRYSTTHTNPGARAPSLFDRVTITSSGLEQYSETSISARSSRLSDQLCEIIDAYLADDPRRALLSRDWLSAPKIENRLEVRRGTREIPFNYLYEERVLRLTEALVKLGQDACRWKEAGEGQSDRPFKSPLPTSPDSCILLVSAARAKDSAAAASPRITEVAVSADADFYLTVGSKVVATVESKPDCRPYNAGDLVRDRSDPFRQEEMGGVHNENEALRLLQQICSQPLAAKRKKGLLIADWGRLLLPFELRSSADEPRDVRLAFASKASWCDVLAGKPACDEANEESTAGLAGQTSPILRLEHLPNTVFALLGWILYVLEDFDSSENLSEPDSQPKSAGESDFEGKPEDEDESKDSAPPAKRTRLQEERGNVPAGSPATRQSSSRRANSGEGAAESDAGHLPLILAYICTDGPILGGTYAAIHRCVVDRAHLRGDRALGSSGALEGGPSFGVLPDLGRNDRYAYLKVQRVPSMPDPEADLPEPRFEEPDGPPLRKEDREGIQSRTAQEIRVFQHCKDLQGTVLPRLYGLVPPESYPHSTGHKLMLQHLDAEPVGDSDYTWRCIWGKAIKQAVAAAFGQIHARRVWHGDVSTSNILVEWRIKKASHSSATKALEIRTLRMLVQEAQDQMRLDHEGFADAARKLEEHAWSDAEGNSGLAVELPESPLSRLANTVKPHVWVIDFAGSAVVEEGEEGDSLLTSEAHKVEEIMEKWASGY